MLEEVDYLIVGAGPAGCALAARLAASPTRPSVALIEAGRPRPSVFSTVPLGVAALVPFGNPYNYAYRTLPQPGLGGRRGYVPRGRGVGGSSLINAMIYSRGHPQDYDDWEAMGATGWGWKEIGRAYREMEGHALGGARQFRPVRPDARRVLGAGPARRTGLRPGRETHRENRGSDRRARHNQRAARRGRAGLGRVAVVVNEPAGVPPAGSSNS